MAENTFSASLVSVKNMRYPYGHDVRYNYSLCNAAALQGEWTIRQDYRPPCENAPTSWMFRMSLERDPNNLLVSGSAKIIRTDSIQKPIRLILVVKVHHPSCGDYIPIPEVDKVTLPGHEILVNVSNIVPHTYNYLLREELSMTVYIYVRDCHRKGKKEKGFSKHGFGPRWGKLWWSKM